MGSNVLWGLLIIISCLLLPCNAFIQPASRLVTPRGRSIYASAETLEAPAPQSSSDDGLEVTKTKSQQSTKSSVLERRNFAIISHPDSGKTTLTEKLLLYGGAINEAGAVRYVTLREGM